MVPKGENEIRFKVDWLDRFIVMFFRSQWAS